MKVHLTKNKEKKKLPKVFFFPIFAIVFASESVCSSRIQHSVSKNFESDNLIQYNHIFL